MMKISDMVLYLKNKNIKFNYCSEQDAEIYLKENNNYYNVLLIKIILLSINVVNLKENI